MRAAEYRLSQVSRIVSAVMSETSSSGASCLWRFLPLLKAFMRRRMTFKAEIWACRDAASSSADAAASRGGGPIILVLLGSPSRAPGAARLGESMRTTRVVPYACAEQPYGRPRECTARFIGSAAAAKDNPRRRAGPETALRSRIDGCGGVPRAGEGYAGSRSAGAF